MLDLDPGILVSAHMILKSGDRYIGPFPPFEDYVRHWAKTNGYAVDSLESLTQGEGLTWSLGRYTVTDDRPGDISYFVRLGDGRRIGMFYSEKDAANWGVKEAEAKEIDCSAPIRLFHPYFLEKND